jgi:putative RNA 2'-phosphotransferase
MQKELVQLSKTISHALRHEPWLYELELDEEGWTSLEALLDSLRRERPRWNNITAREILRINEESDKKRFEVKEGRIRAFYGHSLPGRLVKEPAEPPEYLYHGTSRNAWEEIRKTGLSPMKRQYVHLSADRETAMAVGQRKDREPLLLVIEALKSYREGTLYYRGNERIWLADRVAAQHIGLVSPAAGPPS